SGEGRRQKPGPPSGAQEVIATYEELRRTGALKDGMTITDIHRKLVLSSDAKCNPPRRFDIGEVVQDLKECCHAILFASVGGRKRPDRRFAGCGAVDGGHCPGARSGESHHLQGGAAERTPLRRVLAASRRRSLSIAQAA